MSVIIVKRLVLCNISQKNHIYFVVNIFTGAGVALITPFKNGNIDFESFDNLCYELLERGVKAFVVLGTTGEPQSLTPREKAKLVSRAVCIAKGRIPVVAGVSKNSTAAGIIEADVYSSIGADGLLVITPYCSKSTPDGLKEHYRRIKAASGLPIIAYNVPTRTGYDLDDEIAAELTEEGAIQGIKQASASVNKAVDFIRRSDYKCSVYSGEDSLTVPFRSIGAVGSISVLALVMPEVAEALFDLPIEKAGKLQVEIGDFVKTLFCEINPVPVKYLLSYLGKCENSFRLPLSPLSEEKRKKIEEEANKLLKIR